MMLHSMDTDKWIVNVLEKYQNVKKSKKKKYSGWYMYITPFHLAALIGHLWLWQSLLKGLFCNDKGNKFASYDSPKLALHF